MLIALIRTLLNEEMKQNLYGTPQICTVMHDSQNAKI